MKETIGEQIYNFFFGIHPELGPDFFGSKADWESALFWQYKYEPIEDEL